MREPRRNPRYLSALRRKLEPHPLAESRGAPAQIHGHIVNPADNHPDQFALRLPDLVVKAAQHVSRRAGMIILDEVDINTGGARKNSPVIPFQEKPSCITVYLR